MGRVRFLPKYDPWDELLSNRHERQRLKADYVEPEPDYDAERRAEEFGEEIDCYLYGPCERCLIAEAGIEPTT